jgi:prepilin-type N-terminal cleavage/methylation domain-containing protein
VEPRRALNAFTLLETLIALAVAGLVATALAWSVQATSRLTGGVAATTDAAQQRALAAALLRGEIERAGRGGAEHEGRLAIRLDPEGGGGDTLEIGYLAEADRAEATILRASFFAARDASGRPNLYRRPPAAVRQPWLLGVTGVHLLGGRDDGGRPLARDDLLAGTRVAAVEVELRFATGPPERVWASTRRVSALDAPRWGAAP